MAHGLHNQNGPDNGDLPNIFVIADGSVTTQLFTPWIAISRGQVPLLDRDGSALVIHANADNHSTQPMGESGGRTACGAITPN